MSEFPQILITGVTGSGGSFLAEYINSAYPNTQIHGISRWHSTSSGKNISKIQNKVINHECDLCDFSSIFSVLKQTQPSIIFHIASHANVHSSFTTPLAVMQNNIMGTVNLLEAIHVLGIDPIIQICSTSEVYGQVSPENVPIKEECPFNPSSPYAVSKTTQDLLGYTYFKSYNMKIIRTRMFAYLNPRRSDLFATSFAMQVARIEAGLQEVLIHGNLESVRTLIDVRDAMEAYWVAATKCKPGEAYNIGGKKVIKVGDFLDVLKNKTKSKIESRLEPSLLRPADVTLQIPDTSKFQDLTGWNPRYTFEESVEHLLNYCRTQINHHNK